MYDFIYKTHPMNIAQQKSPNKIWAICWLFFIGLKNKEDAEYLINALKENYGAVTEDWNNFFWGISLSLDHQDRTVDIIMPG